MLEPEGARAARDELRAWHDYRPTPLLNLDRLAERLGVAAVACKDESARFGIGSFKALGGGYAVLRVLQDVVERASGLRPSTAELARGEAIGLGDVTVITASAGNHGRSVAWGCERFHCGCVVVLPAAAERVRAEAITGHGARVVRFPGDYDEAVSHAEQEAAAHGWHVVSDTAYPGYEEVPRRVMEGYTLLADELLEQWTDSVGAPPTHLFVQAGVGGLATGVCGHLARELGEERPRFIAVEPWRADCFGRSLRRGARVRVPGPFATRMGGLASGEPSLLAWRVLAGLLDGAVAMSDAPSEAAARALASGELGATVEAGPSGAAGVGALLALTHLPSVRELFRLEAGSRVAALVTERRFGPEAS